MSSLDLPVTAKPTAAAPRAPRTLSTRWISGLTLASLLALWWLVTAAEWIEPLFLPSPEAVLGKALSLIHI